MQELLPGNEKNPAAQDEQAMAPLSEVLPAGQSEQAVRMPKSPFLPAGQGVQEASPGVAEKRPVGHCTRKGRRTTADWG